MNPIIIAGTYAFFGDVLATFLASTMAVIIRHWVSRTIVGAGLGVSAGFILGVAFFDLIPEAQQRSQSGISIAVGISLGLLLMVIHDKLLAVYGIGEER